MDDEAWNQAMEQAILIVSVETVLQEVAGREGSLFREKLEENITGRGLEENFGGRRRLDVVNSTHLDG